jgi:hypothetical protein
MVLSATIANLSPLHCRNGGGENGLAELILRKKGKLENIRTKIDNIHWALRKMEDRLPWGSCGQIFHKYLLTYLSKDKPDKFLATTT